MDLASFLKQQLRDNAQPEKAVQMQAYMKMSQPFYGVAAPERKLLFKEAKQRFTISTQEEYEDTVIALWRGSHREEQYQALMVAEQFKAFRNVESVSLYEQLLHSATHWDTVDWIAITLAGLLIKDNKQLEHHLLHWREDANFWLRRAAIIAHIKHKQKTNLPLLAETILMLAHEKEFFIRKAIGWALREYSKTDKSWVVTFVDTHQNTLSGLSQREALKIIRKTTS